MLEVRPLGVQCNMSCRYCYQHKYRHAGGKNVSYDLDTLIKTIRTINQPVDVFGGEPLLMPIRDLEQLFKTAYELHGFSTIQTNGVLVTDDHLAMFEKYKVYVGLSCDGPKELNDLRWAGSLQATREATARTMQLLTQLRSKAHPVYLQVQLTKTNASREKLDALQKWFLQLDDLGMEFIRIHVIDSNCLDEEQCLSADEYSHAYKTLYALQKKMRHIRFDVFSDMAGILQGKDDEVTCVFRGCDHYSTEAVIGLTGNQTMHNCGAMDHEGIYFQKPAHLGYERSIMLYHTPFEYGGCQGCRFFLACKGHCPGNALDGDWRNRSEHCDVWRMLFELVEKALVTSGICPISLHAKRTNWEQQALAAWQRGYNLILEKDLV